MLTSPVAVTFLNPLISLLASTINAFPAETVPSTTVFNLLISSALDVIAVSYTHLTLPTIDRV